MPIDAWTSRGFRVPSSVVAPLIVVGALVVAQLVCFAGVQSTVSTPVSGGRPFLIQRIPNGTTFSQPLDVRANGLEVIELSGTVVGATRSGYIDATLVELSAKGMERQVRQAHLTLSRTCCAIAFQPVEGSAGRRYRLDLRIRDFDPAATLSLAAVPVREGGGVTINGRVQAATLQLSASAVEGTAVARLWYGSTKSVPLSFRWFLMALIAFDAAVGCSVAGIERAFVTASDPRHC